MEVFSPLSRTSWAVSIQPKILEISFGTSNGTYHFSLVWPEYSGPALKVVLFDRSGHFSLSDRNAPFHLTKLLSPEPLFCILLTRTISTHATTWVGSVQPEWTIPLSMRNFRNFTTEFLLNRKHPLNQKVFRPEANHTNPPTKRTCTSIHLRLRHLSNFTQH